MASQNPNPKNSLYPEVVVSHPDASSPFLPNPNANYYQPSSSSSSSSNLYPKIDMNDLVVNLFPEENPNSSHHCPSTSPSAPPLAIQYQPPSTSPSAQPPATQEVVIKIPGAILNLIDKEYSVELACGDFTILHLRQGSNAVALLARVADKIQWSLSKNVTAVKLDNSHYFFSFQAPTRHRNDSNSSDEEEGPKMDDLLSYGLTIASKGQDDLLKELDKILEGCSNFSEQKVSDRAKKKGEALDGSLAKEISPEDLMSEKNKELMEGRSAAYWTTLAPNVEDYSGTAAKLIATGSGQLIKGILWCGDVTVDRLKRGNDVMKMRMTSSRNVEVSPQTLARIQRVKSVTRVTEKAVNGILSGVVKVSGYFTSSVANSKMGKKIFGLLPEEVLLASFDGFSKVCDAVEVAGKNVMSTSSTVTTDLVTHRYGEQAATATNEGLEAAGHAVGTAWAAFKIRQAFNPKTVFKPTALAKAAAAAKKSK